MKNSKMILLSAIGAGVLVLGILLSMKPWERTVPVSLTYRKAHLDISSVAQVHNNSNGVIKVMIEVNSPSTGEVREGVKLIEPRGYVEVGWLEGFRLVPGDIVSVRENGFRAIRDMVPF